MISAVKRWLHLPLRKANKKARRKSGAKKKVIGKRTKRKIQDGFSKAKDEIRQTQTQLSELRKQIDSNSKDFDAISKQLPILRALLPRIERLEQLQQKTDSNAENQWKWIQHLKEQAGEQRVTSLELKAKISELQTTLDSASKSIESSHKHHVHTNAPAQPQVQPAAGATTQPSKAKTPIEIFNSLSPKQKLSFASVLNAFGNTKDGWVAFADIRAEIYPNQDARTATALLSKILRPLHELGLLEKDKRDNNNVFLRPTQLGVDAVKEAGMIKQQKTIDELYARLSR